MCHVSLYCANRLCLFFCYCGCYDDDDDDDNNNNTVRLHSSGVQYQDGMALDMFRNELKT